MRNWKGIVVHHSASGDVSAGTIDDWHKQRGWSGIGYHFVIRSYGEVELGRSLNKDGAHAKGRNQSHIGICVTGQDVFTEEQIETLAILLRTLSAIFSIPADKIERHHEKCPGPGMPLEAIAQVAVQKPLLS